MDKLEYVKCVKFNTQFFYSIYSMENFFTMKTHFRLLIITHTTRLQEVIHWKHKIFVLFLFNRTLYLLK